VFTRSKCPSAPVDWCRAHQRRVGAGAGRQFRQRQRLSPAERTARPAVARRGGAAKAVGALTSEIFMASTGVIGEPLDGTRIARVMEKLVAEAKADAPVGAAKAIMTTDTFPKIATARVGSAAPRS
jgi:glutamate N-acetyltransferase/amino-acid N-acetyltransferase